MADDDLVIEVLHELDKVLTPAGVSRWLVTPADALGGRRPAEVLADEDGKCVLRLAKSYSDPSYG